MKEGTTGGIKKAKMKKESEKKEDKNMIDDAILLMDNYGPDSQALHTSLKLAGFDCPAVVLEDDGFLPEDVMSVYGFFLGDFKAAMGGQRNQQRRQGAGPLSGERKNLLCGAEAQETGESGGLV